MGDSTQPPSNPVASSATQRCGRLASPPSSGRSEVVIDAAVFDRYRDAWNNHDVDAVLEFFTDDGVYEDVTVARVNRGKAEIRAFIEETFAVFPDFHVEDGPVIIDPSGRYGLEWTMSGTHEGDTAIPATHKRFSLRGASGGEFEGDKIKRNSDYWNMAEFLAQVGILPPPPSA